MAFPLQNGKAIYVVSQKIFSTKGVRHHAKRLAHYAMPSAPAAA